MARIDDVNESRLLTNTERFRQDILSRNLYSPDTEYSNATLNEGNKLIKSIDSVIDVIAPFKSVNIDNSVVGRLVSDRTPLTEIGLVMLGQQFAYNSASQIARENFPEIKPSNLWDGDSSTKLFTLKKEMDITVKEPETFGEKITGFLDKIIYTYPMKNNPFDNQSTNEDYYINTGKGQLQNLYKNLNQNLYKPNERIFVDSAEKIDINVKTKSALISNRRYFDFNDNKFNPYGSINFDPASIIGASSNYYSNSTNTGEDLEYAPDLDYIESYMGKTNVTLPKTDINNWVDDVEVFSNDNNSNKLIWGRDGITAEVDDNVSRLRGEFGEDLNTSFGDLNNNYNVKTGLLEYTRNLLNASDGNLIDITRKAFKSGDKIVGFNGSSLFQANNSTYAQKTGISNVTGVRQHAVHDQYNSFAKAIRFDGNYVYNGNPNSVINETVLPQIFPKFNQYAEGNKYDTRKLMFSIENLAYDISEDGSFGKETWNRVPLHEIGPNNGRIMWFPPYGISINETTTASYEPTVMIGRNEPMYNYMHSERNAVVMFKLLVDYPEQLKNLEYQGENKHKIISEFFAFGGNEYTDTEIQTANLELKVELITNQIDEIKGNPSQPPEEIPDESFNKIEVFFPNDEPISSTVNTIIDRMYYDLQYEIIEGTVLNSSNEIKLGNNSKGLNKNIYDNNYIEEVPSTTGATYKIVTPNVSQYSTDGFTALDNELRKLLINDNNRGFYQIELVANSSQLYLNEPKRVQYNIDLAKRRAEAIKHLIRERVKVITSNTDDFESPIDIERFISKFIVVNNGDRNADPKYRNAPDKMYEPDAKKERRVTINIERNNVPRPKQENVLSSNDIEIITQLESELNVYLKDIDNIKKSAGASRNYFKGNADGILNGFKSISENKYYPLFHTQTPEDFHRRLTFLQQCMRQGEPTSSSQEVDSQGIPRAKNSVFGRQPICILRIGDFFYTKVVIESLNIDYEEPTWDLNPEGFGLQPMIADVTLNMKVIGGQSLKGPINALQNAISFNYYANSTFKNIDVYRNAVAAEDLQYKSPDIDKQNNNQENTEN